MTDSVFTDQYERFREILVQARRDASMTQVELAESLDRPQSFVSKYERGERRLDVVEFLEVTKAIGVNSISIIKQLDY